MKIEGKWALVTGASRGIGHLVAKALADKGCNVIAHSRNLAGTSDLVNQCLDSGVKAFGVAAELSVPQQVEKLIGDVNEICPKNLDILYNNAAVMTPFREKYQIPWQDYSHSFQVNVAAPAKLADAFIPKMLSQDWGRIIMVTSGIEDLPELMPYSCSKAAVDRYVRDMVGSLEGSNVLLNLMDPGWLRTDLGGSDAPNAPETVLPGALVPVMLEKAAGSGRLYRAQDYRDLQWQ